MLRRLLRREAQFLELFNQHAAHIVEGSRELAAMLGAFTDLEAHAQRIDTAERAADKVTREVVRLLHKGFLTPFDRDQILDLINTLDDILDLTQDVAESVALYDLKRITPETTQLAELCRMSSERVQAAVGLLNHVKQPEAIFKCCEEIDRLESDADRVLRAALSKLFREESDLKQVMKLRVIYDLLESITDRCEDAANVIEGIALENS
jgi:predicted phosphate transport protein (TIGR00153 family)